MPYFTPDCEKFAVGRPYATWWVKLIDDAHWLCFKDKTSKPVKLYAPFQEELDEYQYTFDSGRETFVDYQLVRDLNLTEYGRVFYRDDFDDQYTDQYIAKPLPGRDYNKPFDRAVVPEPIWEPIPPPEKITLRVTTGRGYARLEWDLDATLAHEQRVFIRDYYGNVVVDEKVDDNTHVLTLREDDVIKPWFDHYAQVEATWWDGTVIRSDSVLFEVPEVPEPAVDIGAQIPQTTNETLVVSFSYGYWYSIEAQKITEFDLYLSYDDPNVNPDGWFFAGTQPRPKDQFPKWFYYTFPTPARPSQTIYMKINTKNPWGETMSEWTSYRFAPAPVGIDLEVKGTFAGGITMYWTVTNDDFIRQRLEVTNTKGELIHSDEIDPSLRQYKWDDGATWVHEFAQIIVEQWNGDGYASDKIEYYVKDYPQEPTNIRWVVPGESMTFDYNSPYPANVQDITNFTVQCSTYPVDYFSWKDIGSAPGPNPDGSIPVIDVDFKWQSYRNYWIRVVPRNPYGQTFVNDQRKMLQWNSGPQ